MRRSAAALFSAIACLTPFAARADVKACLADSERGQEVRAEGKLREAARLFASCQVDACPKIVRLDCARWREEVTALQPTVVLEAKDPDGTDLSDVTVTVDGEIVAKQLDGKAIVVDPGAHTFQFATADREPMSSHAIVREGEKARIVAVRFPGPSAEAALDDVVRAPAPPAPDGDVPEPPRAEARHGVVPWIVVGAGAAAIVAGAVVYATASSRPASCHSDSRTCDVVPGESTSDTAARIDRAGSGDEQRRSGLVVGAVGLGAVAVGLVWHFLEPTSRPTATSSARTPTPHTPHTPRTPRSFEVAPWLGPNTGGATLQGTF